MCYAFLVSEILKIFETIIHTKTSNPDIHSRPSLFPLIKQF